MSFSIVVEDNGLDWQIVYYQLKKYPVFDNVLHLDGGLPLINYIKKTYTKSLICLIQYSLI